MPFLTIFAVNFKNTETLEPDQSLNAIKTLKPKRIAYIDIIRSIAIIMMLEGHFIGLSLAEQFKDKNNPIYWVWNFKKGFTSPLFLTISGLIFTFLLLKDKGIGIYNVRLQKGIKRGLMLIATGYLLQFDIYGYFYLNVDFINGLTIIFHVLQCIGACLIGINVLYLIKTYLIKIPFGILSFIVGFLLIILAPTMLNLDYTGVPRILENILIESKDTSSAASVFPLFPWAGYVFLGATIGSLLHRYNKVAHSYGFPIALIAIGIYLQFYTGVLKFFWNITQNFMHWENFSDVYEFNRLGQVFIIIGSIIILHKNVKYYKKAFAWIPWNNDLFIKVGQNTLSIYTVHVVILYRGLFGFRGNNLIAHKLSPYPAIFGAVLFIAFFVVYVKHLETINGIPAKIFQKLKQPFTKA